MQTLVVSPRVSGDPLDMLHQYATGAIPCYLADDRPDVGWVKYTHRGIQDLARIAFPRKEKRYIFHDKFTVRYDTAFEDVLRGCAEPRGGRTWLEGAVFDGYLALHRMGFAHSFEAWCGDQLAGGCLSLQIGAYITCDTMFHHVSNASKAAYGQTLVRLKERGFEWVDTNCVADHHVNYGEEWVPQWRFERMLRAAMNRRVTITDDTPGPPLPASIRLRLPIERAIGAIGRRLGITAAPEWRASPDDAHASDRGANAQ